MVERFPGTYVTLPQRYNKKLTHLAFSRGRHVRISGLADDIVDASYRRRFCRGKRVGAVVGEVPIHLPRLSEVVGPLDEHGSRAECLEPHDQMSEVELGLQVQPDRDVLEPVLGLPPPETPVPLEGRHDVLDPVAAPAVRSERDGGVADEAFVHLVLKVTHDAVPRRSLEAACR